MYYVFFFKQKTAYEMRISDWSSDVGSSDLAGAAAGGDDRAQRGKLPAPAARGQQRRAADRRHPAGRPAAPGRKDRNPGRSAERRVGKECVSTCRSRLSPSPYHHTPTPPTPTPPLPPPPPPHPPTPPP